jgi:hypothetical protein
VSLPEERRSRCISRIEEILNNLHHKAQSGDIGVGDDGYQTGDLKVVNLVEPRLWWIQKQSVWCQLSIDLPSEMTK